MPRKILLTSAKANMIWQFNKRNIQILESLGFQVHVATNFEKFGSMSSDENKKLKKWMHENGVIAHQVNYLRKLGSVSANLKSYRQLREIIQTNHIDLIHAHSHMAGVIGRLAAHKEHIPAIYTPHGFYFFKGGPKKNWLIYPIEKFLSGYTDTLITIDKEEFEIASAKFRQKNIQYIPGVGVDVRGSLTISDTYKAKSRSVLRKQLGLEENDFAILSVGELSKRKNHEVILRAVAHLNNSKIQIFIAGVGPLKSYLEELADKLNIRQQFHLLGYRNDLHELHFATDLFVFPSLREGLGLAGLEALADGQRILGSSAQGIKDYIDKDQKGFLFNPQDVNTLAMLIEKESQRHRRVAPQVIRKDDLIFDKQNVDDIMRHIYSSYIKQ
ncbi:glycosyltransferase [Oenococcus sp.]|uniref:glycosyltransferase n=1 Tax=Oenococcus sp. TaxID=1979414 RepID=UPI0039EA8D81